MVRRIAQRRHGMAAAGPTMSARSSVSTQTSLDSPPRGSRAGQPVAVAATTRARPPGIARQSVPSNTRNSAAPPAAAPCPCSARAHGRHRRRNGGGWPRIPRAAPRCRASRPARWSAASPDGAPATRAVERPGGSASVPGLPRTMLARPLLAEPHRRHAGERSGARRAAAGTGRAGTRPAPAPRPRPRRGRWRCARVPPRTASSRPGTPIRLPASQLQRVDQPAVEPAQQHVDRLQALQRLQEHRAVAHREVAALDQRAGQFARQEHVLEPVRMRRCRASAAPTAGFGLPGRRQCAAARPARCRRTAAAGAPASAGTPRASPGPAAGGSRGRSRCRRRRRCGRPAPARRRPGRAPGRRRRSCRRRTRSCRPRQARRKPGLAIDQGRRQDAVGEQCLRAVDVVRAPLPAASRAGRAPLRGRRTPRRRAAAAPGRSARHGVAAAPGRTLVTPSSSKARSSRRAALGQAAVAEGGEGAEQRRANAAAGRRARPPSRRRRGGGRRVTRAGTRVSGEAAQVQVRGCSLPTTIARLGHRARRCGRSGRSVHGAAPPPRWH